MRTGEGGGGHPPPAGPVHHHSVFGPTLQSTEPEQFTSTADGQVRLVCLIRLETVPFVSLLTNETYIDTVYIYIYINIYICCRFNRYTYIRKTGNGSLFSLGRQTINGNRRLLFQQTCLSVAVTVNVLYTVEYCILHKEPLLVTSLDIYTNKNNTNFKLLTDLS